MKLALALLALASPLAAQTLTLMPAACGSTAYVNCINVPVAEGGSVWLHFPFAGNGFVQFSAADGLTGTASGIPSYYDAVATSGTPEHFTSALSFVDTEGVTHTGMVKITYHFYLARGSGRGGGGGGMKFMLDGGTITLQ